MPCLRLFVDASEDSEPDDSESEPLESDESELELERFSGRERELGALFTVVARRGSAGGGEDAFFRFSAFVARGFARFSMENEIGLAARFSGGGGARRSAEGRRTEHGSDGGPIRITHKLTISSLTRR